VWWAEAQDKRRPVLVVTRDEAIPVLTWILIAPVTRTVRAIPTEVLLGPDEGLAVDCAAAFDNLQPIRRGFLTDRLGALDPLRRTELCRALTALADC
jgi:mRNA interferase MazF